MSKKAVIVGVSKYPKPATTLEAAVPEAQNWVNLLTSNDTFGFAPSEVETYFNEAATVAAVQNALRRLLKGAQASDQIVFIFAGHGTKLPAKDGGVGEDALLLFHRQGEQLSATLSESDVGAIVKEAKLSAAVDATMVFDCCFSGGVNVWPKLALQQVTGDRTRRDELDVRERDVKVLFAGIDERPGVPLATVASTARVAVRPARAFGSPQGPIIVAACEAGRQAYQVNDRGTPRLLFSSRAVPALKANPNLSYADLVRTIQPLANDLAQKPQLRGDASRAVNPFLT
jgi:hypothetical protein